MRFASGTLVNAAHTVTHPRICMRADVDASVYFIKLNKRVVLIDESDSRVPISAAPCLPFHCQHAHRSHVRTDAFNTDWQVGPETALDEFVATSNTISHNF